MVMVVLSIAFAVPVLLVMLRAGGAPAADPNAAPLVLAGMAATWLGLGGWSVLTSRWRGLGTLRDDFGFWWSWRRDLPIGVAGGVVALFVGFAVAITQERLGVTAVSNGTFLTTAWQENRVAFAALTFGAVVGAPLAEELFFRGLAFTAIDRRLGSRWAVVLSTALFGLLHFQVAEGWSAVFLVLHITTFGFVLGLLRRFTGRCGAGVVAHMTINGFGVLTVMLGLG